MLTLKLKLMKAGSELEKGEGLLPGCEFGRDIHKTDLEGLDSQLLKHLNDQFDHEVEFLRIYLEYNKSKEFLKSTDNTAKVGDRIVDTIKRLEDWTSNNHFAEDTECEVLIAKRQLLLAMIYNKVQEASEKYPTHFKIANFKNTGGGTAHARNALEAAKIFSYYKMTKLTLRAKLISVTINWELMKGRVKQN